MAHGRLTSALLESLQAMQMVASCIEKLGGPVTHEGTMTAEENSFLARLATAQGPAVEQLVGATPIHVMAIFMLQVSWVRLNLFLALLFSTTHTFLGTCPITVLSSPTGLMIIFISNSHACLSCMLGCVRHRPARGQVGAPLCGSEMRKGGKCDPTQPMGWSSRGIWPNACMVYRRLKVGMLKGLGIHTLY